MNANNMSNLTSHSNEKRDRVIQEVNVYALLWGNPYFTFRFAHWDERELKKINLLITKDLLVFSTPAPYT